MSACADFRGTALFRTCPAAEAALGACALLVFVWLRSTLDVEMWRGGFGEVKLLSVAGAARDARIRSLREATASKILEGNRGECNVERERCRRGNRCGFEMIYLTYSMECLCYCCGGWRHLYLSLPCVCFGMCACITIKNCKQQIGAGVCLTANRGVAVLCLLQRWSLSSNKLPTYPRPKLCTYHMCRALLSMAWKVGTY
jgi:hypothetical protein